MQIIVFWTAQGKYLTLTSTKETAGLHSGIFWASAQGRYDTCFSIDRKNFSLAFGGIFLYIVFRDSSEDADISKSTTRIIYGVFSGVTMIGLVILGTSRLKKKDDGMEKVVNESDGDEDEDDLTPMEMISKKRAEERLRLRRDCVLRLIILLFFRIHVQIDVRQTNEITNFAIYVYWHRIEFLEWDLPDLYIV